MKRVAVLISGTGSNMINLVQDMQQKQYAVPALVLANTPSAKGLAAADDMGVKTAITPYKKGVPKHIAEQNISTALRAAQVDLICLAGFMRVLSAEFMREWAGKVINIHPSLLPKYKGLNTHSRALQTGDAQHGCTVHWVTAELDDGPILGQAMVDVAPNDTPESLAQKVLQQEHRLYPRVLQNIIQEKDETVIISP